MSIMKVNIAWSIEINNTGIEWNDLQHELAKKLEKTYLHTLSTKEMLPEFTVEIDNKLIEVWLKWDKFNMKLNIGCILLHNDLEGQKIIECEEESKNKDIIMDLLIFMNTIEAKSEYVPELKEIKNEIDTIKELIRNIK